MTKRQIQNQERGGYGWAQWTGFRRNIFEDFAQKNGLHPDSYEANYGYFLHELRSDRTYKDVISKLKAATGLAAGGTNGRWTARAATRARRAHTSSSTIRNQTRRPMSGLFAKPPVRSPKTTEPSAEVLRASAIRRRQRRYSNWPLHLRGGDPDDPKSDPVAHRVGRAVADTPIGIAKYFLDLPRRAIDASSKSFGPDGSYIRNNAELADLSAEIASNFVGGGAVRQFGSAAKTIRASVGPGDELTPIEMLDPPPQPPRPFEADYPHGAAADETGRLLLDIGGRPIRAKRVIGRQVVGGPDVPLPREEYDAVIKAITGLGIQRAPSSELTALVDGRPVPL